LVQIGTSTEQKLLSQIKKGERASVNIRVEIQGIDSLEINKLSKSVLKNIKITKNMISPKQN
tara:strand:+ start:203 stop:388 length:186 start_codon:yes stop_codon:yes gene_type:complete